MVERDEEEENNLGRRDRTKRSVIKKMLRTVPTTKGERPNGMIGLSLNASLL